MWKLSQDVEIEPAVLKEFTPLLCGQQKHQKSNIYGGNVYHVSKTLLIALTSWDRKLSRNFQEKELASYLNGTFSKFMEVECRRGVLRGGGVISSHRGYEKNKVEE